MGTGQRTFDGKPSKIPERSGLSILDLKRERIPRRDLETQDFAIHGEENGIDPGDEIFWRFEGGYRWIPNIMFKGLVRGLYGFDAMSFGLPIATLRREVIYVEPGGIFAISPTQSIEFTVPVRVRGRNWSASPILNVGYYQTF